MGMVPREEFEVLKKRLEDLEAIVHRLARSQKDVIEKYLPEAVNLSNEYISRVAATQTDLVNKMPDVVNSITVLTKAIDAIQDELEFRAGLP